MAANDASKEEKVLDMVYAALVDVIKDTTTDPRLRHPLSEGTRTSIRDCLDLITARRMELTKERGTHREMRPHYTDEPRDSMVVSMPRSSKSGHQDPDQS